MDHDLVVMLCNMIGDDGSDQDLLEQNVLQYENKLWNVIGVNKLDWDIKT